MTVAASPVLRKSVDDVDVDPTAPRERPRRLCTLSRVTPEKGIDNAVRAVAAINGDGPPVVTLDVFGPIEPSYEERFRRLVDSVPHVRYAGRVPPERAAAAVSGHSDACSHLRRRAPRLRSDIPPMVDDGERGELTRDGAALCSHHSSATRKSKRLDRRRCPAPPGPSARATGAPSCARSSAAPPWPAPTSPTPQA